VSETTPVEQRRTEFIAHLHRLHSHLTSPNQRLQADARRILARLRRSVAGTRQEVEAYEIVFAHDPPRDEERNWLLIAGLFALHPQPYRHGTGTIGASMRELEARRGESATRRFLQLVSADRNALPHYLRQAVRLLDSDDIGINYSLFLRDVRALLSDHAERAHNVRLQWARDFYRRPSATSGPASKTAATPSIPTT
jgi:CRISPR system Cascade subunit CasB